MKIGITGTKKGMSTNQKISLCLLFEDFDIIDEFHHGDCIGADAEAHDILDGNVYIVVHPPTIPKYRAYKKPTRGHYTTNRRLSCT
jgi:hypothetical protein